MLVLVKKTTPMRHYKKNVVCEGDHYAFINRPPGWNFIAFVNYTFSLFVGNEPASKKKDIQDAKNEQQYIKFARFAQKTRRHILHITPAKNPYHETLHVYVL